MLMYVCWCQILGSFYGLSNAHVLVLLVADPGLRGLLPRDRHAGQRQLVLFAARQQGCNIIKLESNRL